MLVMGCFRNTRGRFGPISELSAGSPQHLQPRRPACNELLLDGQRGAMHSYAANMQQYGLGDHEQRVLRQLVCWTCLVLMD